MATISEILSTCNARPAKVMVDTSLALFKPGSTVDPTSNGDLVIEATSNTSITVKYKGSDGVVRTTPLTLS